MTRHKKFGLYPTGRYGPQKIPFYCTKVFDTRFKRTLAPTGKYDLKPLYSEVFDTRFKNLLWLKIHTRKNPLLFY